MGRTRYLLIIYDDRKRRASVVELPELARARFGSLESARSCGALSGRPYVIKRGAGAVAIFDPWRKRHV